MSVRRPSWSLALLAGLLAALPGCMDDERKPIPIIQIDVLSDEGAYTINHQRVGWDGLKAELRRIADENRRAATGSSRALVHLGIEPGASYGRRNEIVDYCMSVGLEQILPASGGE
jgi:hypothetical protein